MRFSILGPLRVEDDGRELAITAGRDRTVLAMLLLHPERIVSVDRLIDAVWGEDPPATARGQLQTCVSRLRRLFPAGAIRTDPAGYGVRVPRGDLDLTRFDDLVAAGAYRPALDLWHGPALAGLDSPVVRRYAAALDERYALTAEDWVDQEIREGGGRDLIGDLSALVDRFPLRERLRGQLITVLVRAGRRADALAEFRRARAVLQDELGIEPGADLQELHRRVLADEPPPVAAAAAPVRCLPRAVGDFTGRGRLVATIREQLAAAPPGPVVRVIDGMAGVGKTTLAVHLAGLAGERYPDAHLFIDLHGHSDRRAADPADALVTLLRQLEVPAERIPAGLDDRIALWRSELARRRVLVVLDNAAGSAQVRPLLPGAGDNLTLVTSRSRLTGLDGVRPESIQVLPEPDAVDLFTQIVGDRARAEPAAAAEVVRRCGLLPLAVRLAGARLARRQGWRVADLLRRLGDGALPELASEDRTVAAAFTLSYLQLPGKQQALFRVLGHFPGERFDAATAAAMGELGRDDAEDLLDALVDVHLVEEPEPGVYRLHDLMREYAAMLAGADGADSRRGALLRLIDHATHTAATLARTLEHPASLRSLRLDPPARPDLRPGPEVEALAWLDRERGNYMATIRSAVAIGADPQVWRLARAAWRLWYMRGYLDDLIEAHELGMAAARSAGDVYAVATMANYLASGMHRIGRMRDAADLLDRAEADFRAAGDSAAADRTLSNIAAVRRMLGELDAAVDAATKSLAGSRRRQDVAAIPAVLNELGNVAGIRGDLAASLSWCRRHLMVAQDVGANYLRVLGFSSVSLVRLRLGHPPAERMTRLAVAVTVRFGYRSTEVEGRSALGAFYCRQGRLTEALEQHRLAVEVADEVGEGRLSSAARIEFGLTLLAAGDRPAAIEMLRRAAELAAATEMRYEEARSRAGLARALVEQDPPNARRHARHALVIFRDMAVPERFELEKWLADV